MIANPFRSSVHLVQPLFGGLLRKQRPRAAIGRLCLDGVDSHSSGCSIQRTRRVDKAVHRYFSAGGSEDPDGAPSINARWDEMLEALKKYKDEHGDTLVPNMYPANPSLGNWVDNHRQWYRYRVEAEETGADVDTDHGVITDEKIRALNEIGFVWNTNDHSWRIRYEELKEYAAEHGNALVPWNWAHNEPLAVWVTRQRRMHKRRQESKDPKEQEVLLSDERIQLLEDVGFVFDYHQAQWLGQLEELRKYRSNYGDTLVPKGYTEQQGLSRWVDKQRMDYKRWMAKKKVEEKYGDAEILDDELRKEVEKIRSKSTGMTEERLRLLNAEEFIFDPREHAWNAKFADLCDFAALNGHAAVFRKKKSNPLAYWAEQQRINYKKYLKGEKTTLTEERIAKLNSVNFVWLNAESTGRLAKKARRKASVAEREQ